MKNLWQHQKDTIERALGGNHFAIFHEMGTGKTATVIQVLRHLYANQGKLLNTLIVCPLIVIRNWEQEILEWSKITRQKILTMEGSSKKRIKNFLQKIHDEKNFIAIINYEGLVASASLVNEIKKWQPEILVCDESQRLKNYAATRTKVVLGIAKCTTYRYILTGTPILNSPIDLFGQFSVLNFGQSFGSNFFSFRAMFFVDKNAHMPRDRHFPNWQLKSGAFNKMQEIIAPISSHVAKADCLDLPPLVKQKIYVELSGKQLTAYRDMERFFVAELNEKYVKADLAITKTLRMNQILSGFVKDDDDKIFYFDSNPRLKALGELLDDITPTSKVIVWTVFRPSYRQIGGLCEKLKIKYVECHGDISNNDKFENVASFNNDDSVRVLIGHPGIGVGINLVVAKYCIYYSRTFNLEHDLQSEARNYRGGSEIHDKITRIDIVSPDTIDELILQSLEMKMLMGNELLTYIKNYFLTRGSYD